MSEEKVGSTRLLSDIMPTYVCSHHLFLTSLRSYHLLIAFIIILPKQKQRFDTIALHGGYDPDPSVVLGMAPGAPRGIPVYRTTPFVFKDTEHAANLFKLKELGNIYSRLVSW